MALSLVVYLFLVCYGRSKADHISRVIPSFLEVNAIYLSHSCNVEAKSTCPRIAKTGTHWFERWQSGLCRTSPRPSW